ncbi:Ras GTPase activation domain-containing protein [Planoprotostelium fungivorum]|uniref:Ras GTPase activation domain-containing protein n=1 Tax=Planoprotostelium fungivorum TaxID=1890364 RepID=A0A2P6MP32_9EUKA|nr:Ras GTPase activation domain-containing protein [Planoprotostelium fungivorum]
MSNKHGRAPSWANQLFTKSSSSLNSPKEINTSANKSSTWNASTVPKRQSTLSNNSTPITSPQSTSTPSQPNKTKNLRVVASTSVVQEVVQFTSSLSACMSFTSFLNYAQKENIVKPRRISVASVDAEGRRTLNIMPMKSVQRTIHQMFTVLNDHIVSVVDCQAYRDRRGVERFQATGRLLMAVRNTMLSINYLSAIFKKRRNSTSSNTSNNTDDEHDPYRPVLEKVENDLLRILEECSSSHIELGHFQEMIVLIRNMFSASIPSTRSASGLPTRQTPQWLHLRPASQTRIANQFPGVTRRKSRSLVASESQNSFTPQLSSPNSNSPNLRNDHPRKSSQVEQIKSKLLESITEGRKGSPPTSPTSPRKSSLLLNNIFVYTDQQRKIDRTGSSTNIDMTGEGQSSKAKDVPSAAYIRHRNVGQAVRSTPTSPPPPPPPIRVIEPTPLPRSPMNATVRKSLSSSSNSGRMSPQNVEQSLSRNASMSKQSSTEYPGRLEAIKTRNRARSRSFCDISEAIHMVPTVPFTEFSARRGGTMPPLRSPVPVNVTEDRKKRSVTMGDEEDLNIAHITEHRWRLAHYRHSLQRILLDKDYDVISTLCTIMYSKTPTPEVAEPLIEFYSKNGRTVDFINRLITVEVAQTSGLAVLFRGESMATHMLSYYLKRIGKPYLTALIEPTLREIMSGEANTEGKTGETKDNVPIRMRFERILSSIADSVELCPRAFVLILRHAQNEVVSRFGNHYYVIQCIVFLRFICSAIVNPESYFGLAPPSIEAFQELVKLSKMLQTAVNRLATQTDAVDNDSKVIKRFIERIMNVSLPPVGPGTNVFDLYKREPEELNVPAKRYEDHMDTIFDIMKSHQDSLLAALPTTNDEKIRQLFELRGLLTSGNSSSHRSLSPLNSPANNRLSVWLRKDNRKEQAALSDLKRALEEEREEKVIYQRLLVEAYNQLYKKGNDKVPIEKKASVGENKSKGGENKGGEMRKIPSEMKAEIYKRRSIGSAFNLRTSTDSMKERKMKENDGEEKKEQVIEKKEQATEKNEQVIEKRDQVTEKKEQATEKKEQVVEKRDQVTEKKEQVVEKKELDGKEQVEQEREEEKKEVAEIKAEMQTTEKAGTAELRPTESEPSPSFPEEHTETPRRLSRGIKSTSDVPISVEIPENSEIPRKFSDVKAGYCPPTMSTSLPELSSTTSQSIYRDPMVSTGSSLILTSPVLTRMHPPLPAIDDVVEAGMASTIYPQPPPTTPDLSVSFSQVTWSHISTTTHPQQMSSHPSRKSENLSPKRTISSRFISKKHKHDSTPKLNPPEMARSMPDLPLEGSPGLQTAAAAGTASGKRRPRRTRSHMIDDKEKCLIQ